MALKARQGCVPSLRGLGRLLSIQGLPSIMPHSIIDTPHGVDFPFSKTGMGNCRAYLVVVPEGAEGLQGAGAVVRALRGGQAGPVGLSGSCQEG